MKSKKIILLLLITSGLLLSCSRDDDDEIPTIEGIWHMKNISGGIAGIDDTYTHHSIKWTFNSQDHTLTVANNNPSTTTIYDGFASGIYSYSILESDGDSYIVIEGNEFGKTTLTMNSLTLDQNKSSTDNGNDGFILGLER